MCYEIILIIVYLCACVQLLLCLFLCEIRCTSELIIFHSISVYFSLVFTSLVLSLQSIVRTLEYLYNIYRLTEGIVRFIAEQCSYGLILSPNSIIGNVILNHFSGSLVWNIYLGFFYSFSLIESIYPSVSKIVLA